MHIHITYYIYIYIFICIYIYIYIYIYILLQTATLEVLMTVVVHFDQLRQWQTTDVNRKLLIDFLVSVS